MPNCPSTEPTRSKLHVLGRTQHKARPFKVDLGHTGVSEHVRSGSMSKYVTLASLIAAAQTAIFVAGHVALINSDQADNSGVVSEACLVLQHISECHSWWGREQWSYHRYCDWSLHLDKTEQDQTLAVRQAASGCKKWQPGVRQQSEK